MRALSHDNDRILVVLLLRACILTFFFVVGTYLIKITFNGLKLKT